MTRQQRAQLAQAKHVLRAALILSVSQIGSIGVVLFGEDTHDLAEVKGLELETRLSLRALVDELIQNSAPGEEELTQWALVFEREAKRLRRLQARQIRWVAKMGEE